MHNLVVQPLIWTTYTHSCYSTMLLLNSPRNKSNMISDKGKRPWCSKSPCETKSYINKDENASSCFEKNSTWQAYYGFFLMPSINACRKMFLFFFFLFKKLLINGVRQYFHCSLLLEFESIETGNVWIGEKLPIEAFPKL